MLPLPGNLLAHFPLCPRCALIQLKFTFHSCLSMSSTLFLIWSIKCVCRFWFCTNCNVILLSVNIITVFSSSFKRCMHSNAFKIAICSAWLLVHRSCNLYFNVVFSLLPKKIAIPAPTPTSFCCHLCKRVCCVCYLLGHRLL